MAVVSPPLTAGYLPGRGGWRNLDWLMLALVLVLSIWGCFTVTSATLPNTDNTPAAAATTGAVRGSASAPARGDRMSTGVKQAMWVVVGLSAMMILALSNYQWLMHLQLWMYLANMLLLGVVMLKGHEVNGAKSWIHLGPFALEPSEFCKFALIVCLAAFLCRRQERIRELPTLLWSLLYIAPPLLLILKQPDLGTALAIFSIWIGMMFFGGARLLHLGTIVLLGIVFFLGAWKFGILKAHQKERLAVFLDANPSPSAMQAGGYQIKQSQVAIGGGQITGQGWGRGMQNRSKYVPENSTDFIFTVVAEELGFVGGGLLILGYFLLLWRSAAVALATENYFGVLIAGGFTALLSYHTIVNLGMTMRVMPITGVPLPFFSYGGSSYLAFSLCIGLLQSIALRRKLTIAL
jgi:rod shape determining protein RodA